MYVVQFVHILGIKELEKYYIIIEEQIYLVSQELSKYICIL